MKRAVVLLFAALLCSAAAHADFVILKDGRSYSGVYTGARTGMITFTDASGIEYSFPLGQVQSLVFSNVADHVALRNGQSYSGHLTGATQLSFRGSNGVGYVFPLRDVASLVITNDHAEAPAGSAAPVAESYAGGSPGSVPPAPNAAMMNSPAGQAVPSLVIPSGSQIVVRTDTGIDTATDTVGKVYSATIEQDVVDSTGTVGIPAGTSAQLKVIDLNQGNTGAAQDLALALDAVTLNGTVYRVDASSVVESSGSAGYGMNKRTAEYAGSGAGLGALLGAVFGGGRGAGIGALAGGGMGALTQYLTRGKRVHVPAEATLTFQLQRTMILHP
jgi:hypothetical protein